MTKPKEAGGNKEVKELMKNVYWECNGMSGGNLDLKNKCCPCVPHKAPCSCLCHYGGTPTASQKCRHHENINECRHITCQDAEQKIL